MSFSASFNGIVVCFCHVPKLLRRNSKLKKPYFGVRFQGSLQLLWFGTVSKWHLHSQITGNSLKVAVCALQVRKKPTKSLKKVFLFPTEKNSACIYCIMFLCVAVIDSRLTSVHVIHADDSIASFQHVCDGHRGCQPRGESEACMRREQMSQSPLCCKELLTYNTWLHLEQPRPSQDSFW